MDTKPLERFATWARHELLTAVEAQATAVLKADSIARSERGGAVRALETEINRHGREHVIDKVAYTWFNRIIALRFMDARGYTGAGIVSPTQGQQHGQPEILADAKRGDIDTDVVTSSRTADAIIGLLDGTRRSTDAEGEAYALLLTAYCHYWHGPMPFMFEREDNYTELLVPANLLADDAILSRALEVLTEDVCDDVEVIGWLYQFYISERKKEVFAGFSAKGEARKLAGPDEIPAATQLFTPHWIVRYLVENSLGRLWMLNHPDSQLIDQMEYYITPVDEEIDFLTITKPEELTVIDPACGSGHMLTYAFDLLYEIYVEEGYAPSEIPALILANNLYGTEIDPRAGALAAFALVMKARAKQRTFFNRQVEPNICVIERILFTPDELDFLITLDGDRHEEAIFWNQFSEADTLGSLIQPDAKATARLASHLNTLDSGGNLFEADVIERANRLIRQAKYLLPRYFILVANPPYMGRRNMNSFLSDFINQNYPSASADLYLGFFLRSMSLVVQGGYVAQVAMKGWLHAAAQTQLRSDLLRTNALVALMPMRNKVMPIDFETAAAVWIAGSGPGRSRIAVHEIARTDLDSFDSLLPETFINLASSAIPSGEYLRNSSAEIRFNLEEYEFQMLFNRPPLIDVSCKVGLQTGDVQRFVRYWHEVSSSTIADGPESACRWAPYAKAGGARRWYGFTDYVVDWLDDGTEIKSHPSARPQGIENYWRPGIEWSDIGHHDIGARLRPAGYIFDVVAMSLFVEQDDERRLLGMLAYLNSSVAGNLMNSLSSGLHYSVGYVAKLPEPELIPDFVVEAARRNVNLSTVDWNSRETSRGFSRLPLLEVSNFDQKLLKEAVFTLQVTQDESQRQIEANDLIIDQHFMADSGAIEIAPDRRIDPISIDTVDDIATDFISYMVGCIFGRYSLNEPGLILGDQGTTLQDYLIKVPEPSFMPDLDNVIPIVDGDWFEDDIVERSRQFLRTTFGEEHFEENLRFIEESLGVKTLRDYFITKTGRSKFYDDHVQRYKKRPIYWMFSSPKGSFNALIYMHRYTPSTVSTVLNEYLREYRGKLEVALQNTDREAASSGSSKAQKEADRIRKVLVELAEYEHDVLYPLATQQIVIDLDDGVKVNYPKFGKALKKIKGLEATE